MNPHYAVQASDLPQLKKIWRRCFPQDTPAFVDWFFDRRYAPERVIALRQEDRIRANLHMIPYNMSVRGQAFASLFIVGAATHPHDRGKGHMGELLRAAFVAMREAGVGLSHLYPFHYDFYRRHGYDVCSARIWYDMPPARLAESAWLGSQPLSSVTTTAPLAADICALSAVYAREMAPYAGYALRQKEDWRVRLEDLATSPEGAVSIGYRDGRPAAYALYTLCAGSLQCVECLGDMAALLSTLCGQQPITRLGWPAPVDDTLVYRLREGRDVATLSPFGMLRLVDIQSVLNALPCPHDVAPIALQVQDDWAPWNAGVWKIWARDGRMRAQKTAGAAQLALDIRTLGQLVNGFARPSHPALSALFPPTLPYFFEMY